MLREVADRPHAGGECRLQVLQVVPHALRLTVPAEHDAHHELFRRAAGDEHVLELPRRLATSYGSRRRSSIQSASNGIACATTGSCSPQRRRSTPGGRRRGCPGSPPWRAADDELGLVGGTATLARRRAHARHCPRRLGEPCASGAVLAGQLLAIRLAMKVHERHSCRSKQPHRIPCQRAWVGWCTPKTLPSVSR